MNGSRIESARWQIVRVAVACLLVLTGVHSGTAAPLGEALVPAFKDRIDFKVVLSPADVFSDRNASDKTLKEVYPGEVITLRIVGLIKPKFHTFPLTVTVDTKDQPKGVMSLTYDDNPNFTPLYPIWESPSEFVVEPGEGVFLEHTRPFTWIQEILVSPKAKLGPTTLHFRIGAQACSSGAGASCQVSEHDYEIPLTISKSPEPIQESKIDPSRLREPKPRVLPIPAALIKDQPGVREEKAQVGKEDKAQLGKDAAKDDTTQTQQLARMTLALQIFWTAGAALLMLFTPCVFPMIPVTLSLFLKQSEKSHKTVVPLALVYAGTIVLVLTVAVLLLGSIIMALANNAWLNLGFGALLMFFALSLFGMFELELPSFLTNFTVAREGQGGLVGAVFMALTFSITSFTCTGPFLGAVLTPVAASQLGWPTLVLLSLVYAVTFASPFFLLALFPPLLKSLPKSGTWLNSVKVVMGFIEVGAAFKFLSMADAALHPGDPRWFTYDTVLCSWIALSVACGLYLLGVYRLPNDTPIDHVGVVRLLIATTFFGLAVHLTPNLWHANTTGSGVIGEFFTAILPAPSTAAVLPEEGAVAPTNWYRDYNDAWKEAVAKDKLLFIDFTGVNCPICRQNENTVFSRGDVKKQLTDYVCVQMYNDIVPLKGITQLEAKKLAARNLQWQINTFGDGSLPFYVVFRPDKTRMEAGGKLQGTAVSRYAGAIQDPSAFLNRVLKAPLNEARAQAK